MTMQYSIHKTQGQTQKLSNTRKRQTRDNILIAI